MKQLWRKSRLKPCDNHQHWFIEGFPYFNTRIMTWFNENKIEELKSERIRELRAACKRLVNIGEWDFTEYTYNYIPPSWDYTYVLQGSSLETIVYCCVYYPPRGHYKPKPTILGKWYKIDGNITQAVKILKRHAQRFLKLTTDYEQN